MNLGLPIVFSFGSSSIILMFPSWRMAMWDSEMCVSIWRQVFFLSYLLSHSSEREISITDEQIAYQYKEGRDNRFNIGIAAGGGFEIVTAVGMFQLGGRYSLGFSSVLDKNITPVPNPLMMNSIMITLGYYVQF